MELFVMNKECCFRLVQCPIQLNSFMVISIQVILSYRILAYYYDCYNPPTSCVLVHVS